ncbi:acyl-CoA thioesterase [Nocardioides guangzhouensis]|uniref:Acyl-CoA thioesterase n=1 Tax=Nocardioides guangzhouensis TaxID=2497878 RepID=A0A4Q4ZKU4_9ACTN|nr:thioesterase family protein [Nocardioides guangzhouensis]RYP89002.1 acyl-CoA thioesterase [Nocardioides guangzhouensis]
MRHVYECPVRWADLDLLGHVNNVTYVDYLQEARVDMLLTHAPDSRAEDLAEGVVVVRHEVSFVAPMTFRLHPVKIESWVTDIRAASFTMAYEIYDDADDGGRTVYAQAKTVLTPYVFADERPRRITPDERATLERFLGDDPLATVRERSEPKQLAGGHYPLHVRFSDVDVYGHVNNVKYFEYFQEARIRYLMSVWEAAAPGDREVPLVIAQMDVDYKVPILFRPEPYDVHSWVSAVGRSSFVVQSEIRDGDTLLSRARVVAVTFDAATQRAAPAPEAYRELLRAELARTS